MSYHVSGSIKAGCIREIAYHELQNGSWQREWHQAGHRFYEPVMQVYEQSKVPEAKPTDMKDVEVLEAVVKHLPIGDLATKHVVEAA